MKFSTILRTWWPLAFSWLLMSAEPSAIAAVVARMAHPEINLAAYGSVSFAIVSLIQAPLISLLSLSTAYSRDWQSFQVGKRLMNIWGAGITCLYLLVAFTPLYDLLVKYLIAAPPEIIEPARVSLMVGIPWCYAVGYRRFHQGVLIRFGHSRDITIGTLSRFFGDAALLAIGYYTAAVPGAVLATLTMVAGVNIDALYVHYRVRRVLRGEVMSAPPLAQPVSQRSLLMLYLPLAITPLLNTLVRPIGSAALSRLPDPVTALAIWPVINSFSWLLLTPASALNETVNALIDRPGAARSLIRFIVVIGLIETSLMAVFAATPLAQVWFGSISGLEPDAVKIASQAFWLLVPLGLLAPLGAWFSGAILYARKTRAITEGMIIYLATFTLVLTTGSALVPVSGLFIVTASSLSASLMQVSWLGWRSRHARAALQ